MTKAPTWRRPKEMDPTEKREPVSARLKLSTKDTLEVEAKENGLALAELIANVLDDYVAWLGGPRKKK